MTVRPPFCSRLTMKHKLVLLVLSILCALLAFSCHHTFLKVHASPVIHLQQGKLQGKILRSRLGNEYLAYLGIPYAKAPVASLRFQTPLDPKTWEGVRDATYYRSPCVQMEIFITGSKSGNEDCLFLNVFIPQGKKDLLPIMVYIHGGLFHEGGSEGVSAEYFMDENVILVTLNYRLGVFGFLNTGDGLVRGNMGLKDQSKALQWIQKNIAHFGGNAKLVTIFGESAGAASTHLHVLSPMSKGLFTKAISQSGTALNYWAINRTPKEQAVRIASKVNCPMDDSKMMVNCLMEMDAYTLIEVHKELLDVVNRPKIAAFVPSIETVNDTEAFLTEEPIELLKSGRFNRVPWITGLDAQEGLLISSIITANQSKLDEANDWNQWAPTVMHYSRNDNVSQKLLEKYFQNEFPINTTTKLDKFTQILGDRIFAVAASNAVSLMSKYVPTYMYLNTYRGQFSLAEMMPLAETSINIYVNVAWFFFKRFVREYILFQDMTSPGTCHGDDLFLLFPIKFLPKYQRLGQKDYQMSADVLQLWTDFATKNDTDSMQIHGISWLQIDPKSENQIILRLSNASSLINNPYHERVKFWNSLNLPSE